MDIFVENAFRFIQSKACVYWVAWNTWVAGVLSRGLHLLLKIPGFCLLWIMYSSGTYFKDTWRHQESFGLCIKLCYDLMVVIMVFVLWIFLWTLSCLARSIDHRHSALHSFIADLSLLHSDSLPKNLPNVIPTHLKVTWQQKSIEMTTCELQWDMC